MARVSAEKKAEAALWLASGKSADWVAARCGVHVSTVRAWRRNDPAFKAVLEKQLEGLRGQGLLAMAGGSAAVPSQLRARAGATPLQVVQDAALEIGRKEARRGR
jgi:hypothetical protein